MVGARGSCSRNFNERPRAGPARESWRLRGGRTVVLYRKSAKTHTPIPNALKILYFLTNGSLLVVSRTFWSPDGVLYLAGRGTQTMQPLIDHTELFVVDDDDTMRDALSAMF